MKKIFLLLMIATMAIDATAQKNIATFKCDQTSVTIDEHGCYSSIKVCGREILLHKDTYPVAAIYASGYTMPRFAAYQGGKLVLTMANGTQVRLAVIRQKGSISFEVLECPESATEIYFGPVGVDLSQSVGEVVGIAQSEGIAFGIMALNAKTIGGLPHEHSEEVARRLGYEGMPAPSPMGVIPSWRLAATPMDGGTMFQLSCQDRSRTRYRRSGMHHNAMVLPISGDDAAIVGAKIALYGSRSADLLERISLIETEHGLPHPTIDGRWCRLDPIAKSGILSVTYDDNQLEEVLLLCRLAGLGTILQPEAFENQGHYEWNTRLAMTDADINKMTTRASEEGIRLGVTAHSALVSLNDSYVREASPHLLQQLEFQLPMDIDPRTNKIHINVQEDAGIEIPTSLKAVMIDQEIITYNTLNGDRLEGCRRGAMGTTATGHKKGTTGYRLWDRHGSHLVGDIALQDQIGSRLSDLAANTGISLLRMDDIESCMLSGHDDYAAARMLDRIWHQRGTDLLIETTQPSHYGWHIATRTQLPHTSIVQQKEQLTDNQDFLRRNLMPAMLGSFTITPSTTPDELEWIMSKAVGWAAGYELRLDNECLNESEHTVRLMNIIRMWEGLRNDNALDSQTMERLRDPQTYWHLSIDDVSGWHLNEL